MYLGEQNQWNIAKFKTVHVSALISNMRLMSPCQGLRIDIQRITKDTIEFDLIRVDASIFNAFRRILIAEVRSLFGLRKGTAGLTVLHRFPQAQLRMSTC